MITKADFEKAYDIVIAYHKQTIDYLSKVKDMPKKYSGSCKVVDLDISVRLMNCLRNADVYTLADLKNRNYDKLTKERGFGKKSKEELDEIMKTIIIDI